MSGAIKSRVRASPCDRLYRSGLESGRCIPSTCVPTATDPILVSDARSGNRAVDAANMWTV